MSIFDTHCHYNLDPLTNDWRAHWANAQAAGVTDSVVVGTGGGTSQLAVNIADQEPHLYAAVGIHPSEYQAAIEAPETLLNDELNFELVTALATEPKVVAIGETGLDYFRLPDDEGLVQTIRARQQAGFIQHIQLAESVSKPLIIHVRDTGELAYQHVLSQLKTHHHGHQPFILHCVSGPVEYIKAALELGAYIGMAGNLTYKNADHLRSLVKLAPADRLLLETDAPFLPPVPHRGQTCEPWMISKTAEFVRDELGVDLELVQENARRVFGGLG